MDEPSINMIRSNHMDFNSFLLAILIVSGFVLPVMALDPSDQLNSAGTLYSQSVDLAEAGKYEEALQVSDQALALNVTSMVSLIQANRAGILVMLGRFEEANAAADVSLAREGNLTTAHSIAWYNKGNALRYLGRIEEAKTAFARAAELDPILTPPDLTSVPPALIRTTTKSPVSWSTALLAVALVPLICGFFLRNRE
jgi:tetratricopeptide (TPR) repeat protein